MRLRGMQPRRSPGLTVSRRAYANWSGVRRSFRGTRCGTGQSKSAKKVYTASIVGISPGPRRLRDWPASAKRGCALPPATRSAS
jgi:hypothetical protein